MDKEEKEELEREIRRKFARELEELGGPVVRILIEDHIPPGSEAAKQGWVLHSLGKVWDYTVFVCKCGVGLVAVFVTFMDLPEAVQKFSLVFPETYSKAVSILELVDGDGFGYDQHYDNEPSRDDYYVVDRRWKEGPGPGQYPPLGAPQDFLQEQPVTLVATSGIAPAYGKNT